MAESFLNPTANRALVSRLFRLMPGATPRRGTLSAGQRLAHCTDQLRIGRGEKPVRSLRVPGLLHPLAKWFFVTRALAQGFKKGMKTLSELGAHRGMTPPVRLATDHATLLSLLALAQYGPGGIKHPLSGHLSGQELGEITWLHLDHHLRRWGE